MAFAFRLSQSYDASGQVASFSHTVSDSYISSVTETILDSATLALAITIDVSEIAAVVLQCDQVVTITSQNGSQAAIVLAAGLPYIWTTNSYFTNKLTHDVTTLSVANASGSTATFVMHVLQDATP